MKTTLLSTLIASGIALATLTGAAQAKGRLVVYCSATNEMCEVETKAFGEKYDVKTSFIRNGSGSTLAKVDAEKKTRRPMSGTAARSIRSPRPVKWGYSSPINRKPRTDHGEIPRSSQGEGQPLLSGLRRDLRFWRQHPAPERENLPVPKCWKDLTKPEYKGEIQIADPQSSGTAYTALATFVQLWGRLCLRLPETAERQRISVHQIRYCPGA